MVQENMAIIEPHIHNTEIAHLLGDHMRENPDQYPISRIVRIINRTSLGNVNRSQHLPRGTFAQTDLYNTHNMASGLIIPDKGFNLPYRYGIRKNNKTVLYEGLSLPGFSYGKEIYEHLDVKWNELTNRKLSRRQRLDLIAFVSIVIGTTHAFMDGNGRTDRGTVLFLLENLLGKKLSQYTLLIRKSKYAKLKHEATVRLLPGRFNPKVAFTYMYKNNRDALKVIVPTKTNELKDELHSFLWQYGHNIIKFIDNFTLPIKPNPSFFDIEHSLRKIADFYDKVSGGYSEGKI